MTQRPPDPALKNAWREAPFLLLVLLCLFPPLLILRQKKKWEREEWGEEQEQTLFKDLDDRTMTNAM